MYARFGKAEYEDTEGYCKKLFKGTLAPYALNETSSAVVDGEQ